MADIDIQFSVDDAVAFRAWQRQQAAAAKMRKELDMLKNSSNSAGSAMAGAASKAATGLRDAATAITGIGGAVSGLLVLADQFTKEIETIKKRQSAAGTTQVGLAPKIDAATRNVGGQLTGPEVRALGKKVAVEAGSTPERAFEVLDAAWASASPDSKEAALQTGEVAIKTLKAFPNEDAESQALTVSVVQALMKRQDMAVDEAIGFVLKAGEGNKSRKVGALAKYAIPSGVKGTAFNADLEYSQAVTNVFGHGMMDEDAQLSSHAADVFKAEVRDRFPDMTLEQAIKHMRANPKDARAYIEGGTIRGKKFDAAKKGEGASLPVIEGVLGLSKNPQFDKLAADIDTERARLGNRKDWTARAKAQEGINLSTHEQVVAAQQRTVEGAKQLQQMADMEAGAKGVASEGFDVTMAASDLSGWEQWMRSQGHFWSGGGADNLAAELDRLAEREVSTSENVWTQGTHGMVYSGSRMVPNPNATDQQKIKARNYKLAAFRVRELEKQRKAAGEASQEAEINLPAIQAPAIGPKAPEQPDVPAQPKAREQPKAVEGGNSAEPSATVQQDLTQTTGTGPGPDRPKLVTPAAKGPLWPEHDTVPIQNLRAANAELSETRSHIKTGGEMPPEKIEEAKEEITQARQALREAKGWMTPDQFERHMKLQEESIKINKELIAALERNSKDTANNTKAVAVKPAAPAQRGPVTGVIGSTPASAAHSRKTTGKRS